MNVKTTHLLAVAFAILFGTVVAPAAGAETAPITTKEDITQIEFDELVAAGLPAGLGVSIQPAQDSNGTDAGIQAQGGTSVATGDAPGGADGSGALATGD